MHSFPPSPLLLGWKNSREGAHCGISFSLPSWGRQTTLKEEGNYVSKYGVSSPAPRGLPLSASADNPGLEVTGCFPELGQHSSWNQTCFRVPMWISENHVFLPVFLKWKWFLKNPPGGAKAIKQAANCSCCTCCFPRLGTWEGASPATTVLGKVGPFFRLSPRRIHNVLTNPTLEDWARALSFPKG